MSELYLTTKCVRGFGRFVGILEDQMDMVWKGSLFSMFSKIGLCVGLQIFLKGQRDCWNW